MSGRRDRDLEVDAQGDAYVTIGGIRAKVVDEPEAENCAAVVCGSVSMFPDDVHTSCSRCGAPVVHRPHAPKRPPKICLDCMIATYRSENPEFVGLPPTPGD